MTIYRRITWIILFFFICNPLFSQNSDLNLRILTVPISNDTGRYEYDSLCSFIDSQIDMTLRIIGDYDMYQMPESDRRITSADIGKFAGENSIDKMIYGNLKSVGRNTLFTINVYNFSSGEVEIGRTETIVSVFDIFDVMDDSVTAMLESLTGIHIGYGNFLLENTGEKGTFSVFLDDLTLGSDKFYFENILNGEYLLKVKQYRFGNEVIIHEEPVIVLENQTAQGEFKIPFLLPEEEARIKNLESVLDARMTGIADYPEAETSATELKKLFSKTDFCTGLNGYGKEKMKKIDSWRLFESKLSLIEGYEAGRLPVLEKDNSMSQADQSSAFDLAVYLQRASAFDLFSEKELESGVGTYLISENYLPGCSNAFRRKFIDEYYFFNDAVFEYGKKRADKPGNFLPWSSVLSGVALSGLSSWMFIDNPAADLISEADAAYEVYQTSVDSVELEELHRLIEKNYLTANILEWTKWGGAVGGPLLIGLGITGMICNANTGISEFYENIDLIKSGYIPLKEALSELNTPADKIEFIEGRLEAYKAALEIEYTAVREHPEMNFHEPVEVEAEKSRWMIPVSAGTIFGLINDDYHGILIKTGVLYNFFGNVYAGGDIGLAIINSLYPLPLLSMAFINEEQTMSHRISGIYLPAWSGIAAFAYDFGFHNFDLGVLGCWHIGDETFDLGISGGYTFMPGKKSGKTVEIAKTEEPEEETVYPSETGGKWMVPVGAGGIYGLYYLGSGLVAGSGVLYNFFGDIYLGAVLDLIFSGNSRFLVPLPAVVFSNENRSVSHLIAGIYLPVDLGMAAVKYNFIYKNFYIGLYGVMAHQTDEEIMGYGIGLTGGYTFIPGKKSDKTEELAEIEEPGEEVATVPEHRGKWMVPAGFGMLFGDTDD